MTRKLIAAAAVLAAIVACTKNEQPESGDTTNEGFQKGQQVTLNVTAGTPSTKVNSTLSSDGKKVVFKWEKGDVIKVTVDGASAPFTLVGEGGEASGIFTGVMPAGGDSFDVQYPYETPSLTEQTYSATEPIPHDKMLFTAKDCEVSNPTFTLHPQYSALKLNFYGYDRKVSKIEVTINNSTETYTYTLNAGTPVKVGVTESDATPFYIVIYSGTGAYNIGVLVTAEEVIPAEDNNVYYEENGYKGLSIPTTNRSFATTESKTFTRGICLDMDAKRLTTVWAPVNCGYSSTYTYGLLYQWGRMYGQAYEEGDMEPVELTKEQGEDPDYRDQFASGDKTSGQWFSGLLDNTLWNGSSKGTYDPCPIGWRVPTSEERDLLLGGNTTPGSVTVGGQIGIYFNGNDSCSSSTEGSKVFLPFTGYRDHGGTVSSRGSYGYYWTSSPSNINAYCFVFRSGKVDTSGNPRTYGCAVRCVLDE